MITKDISILRQKSKETSIEECGNLFLLLEKEIKRSTTPAVGLSAIQIEISLRACIVMMTPNQDKELVPIKMINPIIVDKYEPIIFQNEGCLSLNNRCNTNRYAGIVTSWLDYDKKEQKQASFYGLEAIVIQHEIDHMDAILIIDRIARKIGRNEPCFCGSGKKYKRCCGR